MHERDFKKALLKKTKKSIKEFSIGTKPNAMYISNINRPN
ncbi:MAG: hypothetical protein RL407_673 [Bacteroidota bacterium]|jgi:hypothetical protein